MKGLVQGFYQGQGARCQGLGGSGFGFRLRSLGFRGLVLTASTLGSARMRLGGLGLCCFEKGLGIAAVAYHPKLGYLQPYVLCVLDPKPQNSNHRKP